MGLTVHWQIEAPEAWTLDQIEAKLRAAHAWAASLPSVEISTDLFILDKQQIQAALDDNESPYNWACIQGGRHIRDPHYPGASFSQNPDSLMGFNIFPAYGSEDMNITIAQFSEWQYDSRALELGSSDNGRINLPYMNYWKPVLDRKASDRSPSEKQSMKVFKAFMDKYNLKKVGKNRKFGDRFYGKGSRRANFSENLYLLPITKNGKETGYNAGSVGVVKGRYVSHSKGYDDSMVIVRFDDPARHGSYGQDNAPLMLQFKGTVDEARAIVETKEFQQDFHNLVVGPAISKPAATLGSSFCKTQYASDPSCGGIANFLKAHKMVIAILDKLKDLGFIVEVYDEGKYDELRDEQALVEEIGQWNQMIAGFFGAMKDALGDSGVTIEAPITNFSNFEELEFKFTLTDLYQNMDANRQNLFQLHELAMAAAETHEATD